MSVEGFSDKTCECGCGNLLPLAWTSKKARKFLYGHKPKLAKAVPVGDGQRRAPKTATLLRVVSYESMLALVEENLAAVKARRREIEDEISTLAGELAQMDQQLDMVTEAEAELRALRTALAPFCDVIEIDEPAAVEATRA